MSTDLLDHFTPDELRCAVRTLGELFNFGAVDQHEEHLSSGQTRVAAKAWSLIEDE